jgi:hypothetical protein
LCFARHLSSALSDCCSPGLPGSAVVIEKLAECVIGLDAGHDQAGGAGDFDAGQQVAFECRAAAGHRGCLTFGRLPGWA